MTRGALGTLESKSTINITVTLEYDIQYNKYVSVTWTPYHTEDTNYDNVQFFHWLILKLVTLQGRGQSNNIAFKRNDKCLTYPYPNPFHRQLNKMSLKGDGFYIKTFILRRVNVITSKDRWILTVLWNCYDRVVIHHIDCICLCLTSHLYRY